MRLTQFLPILAAFLLLPATLWAQVVWLNGEEQNGVSIEVLKPFLNGVDESFPTSFTVLGARKSMGTRSTLVLEIPWTHIGDPRDTITVYSDSVPVIRDVERTATLRHKAYLGVDMGSHGSPWFVQFGVRVPGPDPKSGTSPFLVAALADAERPMAWAGDTSVELAVERRPADEARVDFRLRLGASAIVASGDLGFCTYRGMVAIRNDAWVVETGLVGSFYANSAPSLSFGERFSTQVETRLRRSQGHVRPALDLRFWLDEDERRIAPVVVGLAMVWVP